MASIWSANGALAMSTVSQPKLRAWARRSGTRSPTITTAAPSKWQDAAQARPTGPAPATYTTDPGPTPALTAPWKPVGKISDKQVRSLILAIARSEERHVGKECRSLGRPGHEKT